MRAGAIRPALLLQHAEEQFILAQIHKYSCTLHLFWHLIQFYGMYMSILYTSYHVLRLFSDFALYFVPCLSWLKPITPPRPPKVPSRGMLVEYLPSIDSIPNNR